MADDKKMYFKNKAENIFIDDNTNVKTALEDKARKNHTHTKSQIIDMPNELPNPSPFEINVVNAINGKSFKATYDGSKEKVFDITLSMLGAPLPNEIYKIQEITKATDWNTLTNTGIYHIKTTECTNCPTTNHGTLYINGSITTIFQMFIPDVSKVIYKRYRSGGTWSSWAPIQTANPNSLVVKLNSGSTEGSNMFTYNGVSAKSINITPSSIGAADKIHSHMDMNMVLNKKITASSEDPVDLNSQYFSGMKASFVIDAGQYANGPAECTGKIDLFLLDSETQHKQIVTDFDTGYVYQRLNTGKSWSEWQLLNDPIIALPSTCDLNNYYYTEWGTMRKYRGLFGSQIGRSVSNSPTNKFTGSAGFINDIYLWTYPSYIFTGSKTLATNQILSVNGLYYKRIGFNKGNSWTEWDQITTNNQVQNQIPDSGWSDVTTGSDFVPFNSGTIPKIRKVGHMVELRGVIKNSKSFSSNGNVLSNIPSTMRPSQTIYSVQTAGTNNIQMTIKTDGTIGMERCSSGSVEKDSWITVCATWLV